MNFIFSPPVTEISVDGIVYKLNTDWESCLWVWYAYQKMDAGQVSDIGYLDLVCDKMFTDPKPDIWNEKALQMASDYLNAFSDTDNKDSKNKIPPINIEQDMPIIYRGFVAMGINLRTNRIDYEEFQARLHELPKDCEYNRINYLRDQFYNNRSKMTKEEKEECKRRGWNKIIVRDMTKKQEDELDVRGWLLQVQKAKQKESMNG